MNDSNINQTPGVFSLNEHGHVVNHVYNNTDRVLHLTQYMEGSSMMQKSDASKEGPLEDFENFSDIFSFDYSNNNKKDNPTNRTNYNTDIIPETHPTAPPNASHKPLAKSYREKIIPNSVKQPFHDPRKGKHKSCRYPNAKNRFCPSQYL